jgi:hypothetical protein
MDQPTARRMARQINATDPKMTVFATTMDHIRGRWEGSHEWVVKATDGRIFRNVDDWMPPVYENPRYVPEKIEGRWRVRDTHNRMVMSDEFGDVMAAEDACLSLNRPQVPPTEPSDSQLRLLCDISAQREDDPELRMRASEVRWLAREARRAAQMDAKIAKIMPALTTKTPMPPWRQVDYVTRELAELPKRTPGAKAPELDGRL